MTDQEQRFQHRWEFRETEKDFDSSSDDDHSRPASASELKLMKHKLVTCLLPEANAQKTMHSPSSSLPRGEKENHSSFEEPNSKPNQSGKMHEGKARSRKTKRSASDYEPSGAALSDLRGYMESLVEGIKTAREDLLAWMKNEMKSSTKDDIISSKPSGTKKGQRQSAKRSKTPRNNANNSRRRSGTTTQNLEDGSLGKNPPQTDEADEKKKIDNKQKGKVARLSTKKQKIAGTETDEKTDKAVVGLAAPAAVATDNFLTLPSVLPRKQVDNSGRIPLEDGNERDVGKRTALASGVNMSSHQLKFDPRAQHKDGVFAQSGLRNVSDYEQNTCPSMSNGNVNVNGNGNMFPFPLVPQGSNAGIGMRNIPSQFGLQYVTQGNRMPGMYREPARFSNENHAFMESYAALNQHLKFNAQQGGVMALQCPDIRRGAFNPGNVTGQ